MLLIDVILSLITNVIMLRHKLKYTVYKWFLQGNILLLLDWIISTHNNTVVTIMYASSSKVTVRI